MIFEADVENLNMGDVIPFSPGEIKDDEGN